MSNLAVANLSASLGGKRVLRDLSFDVGPGEFIGLIGPNGAGKSTLLRTIMGLLPYKGSILLDGAENSALPSDMRALKAAYLAQERDIAWPLTVEALVALGRAPHLPRFAPLRATDQAAIEDAMRRMDVLAFRNRPATELSGGELARVLVARALAQETPLLIADEPTAGLDPAHQIAVMQLFADLAGQGRSVILSTHDLSFAARWCTRLMLLKEGRIAIDAIPDEVLASTSLQDAFGVTLHIERVGDGWVLQPLDIRPGDIK